jgi:hypothetical protein
MLLTFAEIGVIFIVLEGVINPLILRKLINLNSMSNYTSKRSNAGWKEKKSCIKAS